MSDFSNNVKNYRRKSRMTQEQLAVKLNVTRQAVSNWETDKSYPDLDMVVRLAEVLDTDVNSLLYPEQKIKKRGYIGVSGKPILLVLMLFLWEMATSGGFLGAIFNRTLFGNTIQASYLYAIKWGIILLAVLITTCTCILVEVIRNQHSDPEE